MKNVTIIVLFATVILMSCVRSGEFKRNSNCSVKPTEDLQSFVVLGNQKWMTHNLNVSKFNNGELIPFAETDSAWYDAGRNKKPAWCYYENDSSSNDEFGRLYNWYAVIDSRGICPEGWVIPTIKDWQDLEIFTQSIKGTKRLKSSKHWVNEWNGSDSLGMSILPAGWRTSKGEYYGKGWSSRFWSATVFSDSTATGIVLPVYNDLIHIFPYDKGIGYSIRCISYQRVLSDSNL